MLSAECYDGTQAPIFEREILTHLRNGDQEQMGYDHVCHMVDDFEHSGPNGTHVCLVFELMGETLRSFGAWFIENRLPNSVMRRFTIQLLLVLDFAHEHNVIHTGIICSLSPILLGSSWLFYANLFFFTIRYQTG